MRYLRRHPAARWLAQVLAFMLLAPYLLWASPAQAQRSVPSVYVLDFNNKTTVGGQVLGKVAAAQVSLQLSESQNWDVIPDSQVQRRIQELNTQPPFDRVARVQIATGVDATAVVYGSLSEARITTGASPQAYVKLLVSVEDVRTSTLVNGAVAEGLSTPRMGFSGNADLLLEEALGKAAFKAREFMDRFRLPEGTVLNTTVVGTVDKPELDALLNVGARQGVRRGMEMIVTRQREPVGRLRITSVDSDICTGRVTENLQGVKPEDRIRAIFNFGDFPNTRAALRNSGLDSNGTLRVATLKGDDNGNAVEEGDAPKVAKVGKGSQFTLAKAPSDTVTIAQTNVQAPPPVVVDEPETQSGGGGGGRKKLLGSSALRMLVGGALVLGILAVAGRGGDNASRVHGMDAASYQRQIGFPATIKVEWERPKSVRSSQVLGYVIWRSDDLGGFQVVGGLDTDATQVFYDSTSARDVTYYDGDPGSDDAGARTTDTAVPGIVLGQQYRYQVATAYEGGQEDLDGDGVPDEDLTFMSPLSQSSGWATALGLPTITGVDAQTPTPAREVNLNSLELSFAQSSGADTYTIWVSDDTDFRSDNTYKFGPFRYSPVDLGGPTEVTRRIQANRGNLRRKNRVYIAVGAKNSADRQSPKPRGWVFGSFVTVKPLLTPPGPPGAQSVETGGKKNKGDNDRPKKDGDRKGGNGKND